MIFTQTKLPSLKEKKEARILLFFVYEKGLGQMF